MSPFHANPEARRVGRLRSLLQSAVTAGGGRLKAPPLVVASIMACISVGGAESASAATLQVIVTGIRNGNGTVNVCVYTTNKGFPDCSKDPALTSRRQPAVPGTVRFEFNVDPGLHAVSVLHDENNNGRLDTNFLGIPREGVGVSNNPPPRRGPPDFSEAEFHLPSDGGAITVKLVYP